MPDLHVSIEGLREQQTYAERCVRQLGGQPMIDAIRWSTLSVQRDAKLLSPVDTGRLRASITPTVQARGNTVMGIVGSNVEYAPYVELGTKPHWPPVAALEPWARRHGVEAFLVARAIARRGTKARRFLVNALLKNADRIMARIDAAVKKVLGS